MKSDFHNKDFTLSLALKWRLRWTRKWPILNSEILELKVNPRSAIWIVNLVSVSVNITVYFSTEGAKWTNCFLCFAFLYLFQGRDAVPQLLYLSRCDVQSVKLAARRALSSLGKIPRASHVGRVSRMHARILQLFSLLPKFDTLYKLAMIMLSSSNWIEY